MNILIIDDEPGMRDMMSLELRQQYHQVDTAPDGMEGLRRLSDGDYDLIFCDITMPKMSGIDFLKSARAKEVKIPIVMMSGFATVELAVEAMKHGAYDFIEKPFQLTEINLIIKKYAQEIGQSS